MRELLHHILVANRFWLLSVLGSPSWSTRSRDRRLSLEATIERYARTQAQEAAWLETAAEANLDEIRESALIPGGRCSVAEAFIQVCMHSHGHRAQAAQLLRRHGGTPPAADFILCLATRPEP